MYFSKRKPSADPLKCFWKCQLIVLGDVWANSLKNFFANSRADVLGRIGQWYSYRDDEESSQDRTKNRQNQSLLRVKRRAGIYGIKKNAPLSTTCLFAPVFLATVRSSSFISYPKISMNFN